MLKQKGIEKWVFDEIQQMNKIQFDYKNESKPIHQVVDLSSDMHYYPIEDILVKNYLMEEFNKELIEKILNSLELSNLRINLISKSFEKDEKDFLEEEIYKNKYQISTIPESLEKLIQEKKYWKVIYYFILYKFIIFLSFDY